MEDLKNKEYQQRQSSNVELIHLYIKLRQYRQSYLGKLFRFEKNWIFVCFAKLFEVPRVMHILLDDVIYMVLLAVILTVFAVLPGQNSHDLITSYRQYLILLYFCSFIWLITHHWYKFIILFLLCFIYPTFNILVQLKILELDGVSSTTDNIFAYLGIYSLWVIGVQILLVYPLKYYIKNYLGSLYSYLYALSFLTLFGVWPVYSILQEYLANQQVTFDFIRNNLPLLLTFLIIVVFSFYLLAHSTFFQGNLQKTADLLLNQFTPLELIELEEKYTKNVENRPIIYEYFNLYSRIISFIVLAATMASEIYIFIYMSNHIEYIYRCIAIMAALVGFLVLGSIINKFTVGHQYFIYFLPILSLLPAAASYWYYNLQFYEYMFAISFFSYSTIFWCIIYMIPQNRPVLRMNIIVIAYIFVHIPVTLFIINSFRFFVNDDQTVMIINYVIISLTSLTILFGLLFALIWVILSIKQIPKQKEQSTKVLDYNYYQQGDPPYIPYQKRTFSLSWLTTMDLKIFGYIFNAIFFVVCELATIYVFNQILHSSASLTYNSDNVTHIIYSQLLINFVIFTFSHYYISTELHLFLEIVVGVIVVILGVFGIVFSYFIVEIYMFYRLSGACLLILICVFGVFRFLKEKNYQIGDFVAPTLVIITETIVVIPILEAMPIISLYIQTQNYGIFIQICILFTATILVFAVTFVSIIFNTLMNKFEEQRKAKFIMQEVRTYFKDQGVQCQDQILYLMYQSYDHRDKKYVYFLKRGYPVNILKNDQDDTVELVSYDKYFLRKGVTKTKQQFNRQEDWFWIFLTFCCGKDDNELQNQLDRLVDGKIIGEDELNALLPQKMKNGLVNDRIIPFKFQQQNNKINNINNIYSTKSAILKNSHKTTRHLGDEFALLKLNKDKQIAIEFWHYIFLFFSNEDNPPKKIILNDLKYFFKMANLTNTENQINQFYIRFAKASWENILAIDLESFSLLMQHLAYNDEKFEKIAQNERVIQFLIDKVYVNLAVYDQFQHLMSKMLYNEKMLSKQEIRLSPFRNSIEIYKQNQKQYLEKQYKMQEKRVSHQKNKLIQPNLQWYVSDEPVQIEQKTKSCKMQIYEKYQKIKNCCKKEQEQVVKKNANVKNWDFLAVEALQMIQRQQTKWGQTIGEQEYRFRISFNNIMMAAFKIIDLYAYVEVSIRDPRIQWYPGIGYSLLYTDYRIQLYIAFALILICVPMGIRGIMYTLEDRLGLTSARTPATFPHPMFLFISIYKFLIITLFASIVTTLLVTFSCTWNQNQPFLLVGETSLVCFQSQHNIYMILSIVGLLAYYPLSAFSFPNFQFADKILDLKFRPSYLVAYFQVHFVIVAGKVLLSVGGTSFAVQLLFICLNIFCLCILACSVLYLKPCLIEWFNFIELLVIIIGIIVNVMGLVLFLTKIWLLCVIVACVLSVIAIVLTIIYIKWQFFSAKSSFTQNPDQVQQLEMGWQYHNKKNVDLVKGEGTEVVYEVRDQYLVYPINDMKQITYQNQNRQRSNISYKIFEQRQ